MASPVPNQATNNSPTAEHSVAAVHAEGLGDDASSLSDTENDNAKSMRLLHQYFMSLASSGTVRSLTDEKDLVTSKVAMIFKRIKFINADVDLTFEGNIAKILYKQMQIPDTFKAVWWEQMKIYVKIKWMKKGQIVVLL